jgi:hypothetical protein
MSLTDRGSPLTPILTAVIAGAIPAAATTWLATRKQNGGQNGFAANGLGAGYPPGVYGMPATGYPPGVFGNAGYPSGVGVSADTILKAQMDGIVTTLAATKGISIQEARVLAQSWVSPPS